MTKWSNVEINDLRGLFQPIWFCDSLILFFCILMDGSFSVHDKQKRETEEKLMQKIKKNAVTKTWIK